MSSFNINGPSNQPIIQGSQSLGKDGGGGGNTGYMNMRKKKNNEKKESEEDNSVFLEDVSEDTFVKEKPEDKKEGNKFFDVVSNFLNNKKGKEEVKDAFTKTEEDEKSDNPYDDDYYNGIDI